VEVEDQGGRADPADQGGQGVRAGQGGPITPG